MTTTKPQCCSKCGKIVSPRNFEKGIYQEWTKCVDVSCTCHKVNATKPQHEGWEAKTRTFLSQFILHCDQGGDCEGCKYDMDAVIEHVRTHIEAAQEDMRRKCLEAVINSTRPSNDQMIAVRAIRSVEAITPSKD